MRVLRRRVAAMSPREKHLALLSALGIVGLALYYIPTFFYATLILAVGCIVCYYHSGETLPARLGLNPRPGLKVPGVLRRWLLSWGLTGVSANTRGKTKSSNNRNELRGSERHFRQRPTETGLYRREALASDSFLFSPRDILMGSYIGKNESPVTDYGRPRAGRNPREQLREKLSRPNHAVLTPNRRLSFAGEPLGTVGRFTITPQRHYPLQQPGVSSVGVLPPAKWDGFRKKNILSPRNSPGALSPVTVKIARPDHSTPSLDHLSCSRQPRAPADPCSRESVLRVLKESRKREVEEEDRSFTTEQKSKRRRNDSGGSAHSAFESLLPNGTPSQLVPKPGSLKRGMISLAEESVMKRSRTSSISSATGVHTPRGTPGTRRNPIHSSYSSSLGFSQWKKPSAPSPPLSSPGSSRSQTPEGLAKKPREDDGQSPSSASSVRSDHTASDKAPVVSKLTPVPKVPIATSADSTGSGGKRKRKIQLLSSHRDDQITLPPPPELGYAVTVKDLDEEKKAAISKIQKVLETPAPEPEKTPSLPATTSTLPISSTISTSTTFSSLLAAPLSTDSSPAIPVINLDPSPGSSKSIAPPASNPLLEALKMKTSISATASSAASPSTVSASTIAVQPSGSNLKTATTSDALQLPPASRPQSSTASMEQPSAFTQVLGQVSKAASSTQPVGGAGLFGLASQISTPSSSATSNTLTATTAPASSSEAVGNTNPLLASGFKPIFAVTTASTTSTPEIKPPVQNFKPIFGGTTAGASFGQPPSLTTTNPTSTVSSSSTSLFGGLASSTTAAQSVFPGLTSTSTSVASSGAASTSSITTTKPAAQSAVKSLFGNWPTSSTTGTSSASSQAPNTGSTFQFGTVTATTAAASAPAPVTAPASVTSTTTSSNSAFTFGVTQPGPQEAGQKVFSFGQAAASQNTTTSSFGGFGLTNTASTTPATTAQSTFVFGKQPFEAPAAQSTFGSSAAPPKPFTFGSGASSTPASNPTPAPFNFVAAATTTAATFGTPAKPAFGASTTGFAFGGTTAPSAAPNFGAATQTQSSSTFNFGSAASQPAPSVPAQPATGGFNFGAGLPCPQFGTPVSNNPAPQMGSFNFGAAATDKPAFGTPTPSFGQSTPAGPIPFGSPGTPVQGFNAVPFGSPATPSFSIGAGSKPSGARQRLQARRQHNRKK